jgi:hypothetical protein
MRSGYEQFRVILMDPDDEPDAHFLPQDLIDDLRRMKHPIAQISHPVAGLGARATLPKGDWRAVIWASADPKRMSEYLEGWPDRKNR